MAFALAALLVTGTGCGGGGNNLDVKAALQECMGDGMGFMLGIASSIDLLERLIQDAEFQDPNASVTPVQGSDNTWMFDIGLDLDGDGAYETTISGTIAYSADPTDGIEPGDVATISWTASGTEGLGGSGSLVMTYGEFDSYSVSGSGTIDLPGNCGMSYDIPAQAPMTFGFSRLPSVDVLGSQVFGTFFVVATYGSHSLDATLTLAQESNTVDVAGAQIDDVDIDDFSFDIDFDENVAFGLLICAYQHGELTFNILYEIMYALETEFSDTDYGRGTLDVTPTGAFSANFMITFDDDYIVETGDVITGSVSFSGDPLPGSTVTATLRFAFTSAIDGISTSTSANNPIVVDLELVGTTGAVEVASAFFHGQTSSVFSDQGPIVVQQGAGDTCTATMTVPSTAPIDLYDFYVGGSSPGQFQITSEYLGHRLRLSAIVEGADDYTARAYLDGIPIPLDLLYFFD